MVHIFDYKSFLNESLEYHSSDFHMIKNLIIDSLKEKFGEKNVFSKVADIGYITYDSITFPIVFFRKEIKNRDIVFVALLSSLYSYDQTIFNHNGILGLNITDFKNNSELNNGLAYPYILNGEAYLGENSKPEDVNYVLKYNKLNRFGYTFYSHLKNNINQVVKEQNEHIEYIKTRNELGLNLLNSKNGSEIERKLMSYNSIKNNPISIYES